MKSEAEKAELDLPKIDTTVSDDIADLKQEIRDLKSDVKDDISIIGRSYGYKINDYLEDYGSIKRPIDVGLDKLKEIIGTKAK